MQIEIVVPCIIVGFIAPIILFFVIRRIILKRKAKQILEGVRFDKECAHSGIVEEGKVYPVKLRRPQSVKRNKSFVEEGAEGFSQLKYDFVFLYEDPSKRRLKINANIQDISVDVFGKPTDRSESDENSGIHKEQNNEEQQYQNAQQQQAYLEPIPEVVEEEKAQDRSSDTELNNLQCADDNSQIINGGQDKSPVILADLSDIMAPPADLKKTPCFQNKGVINFFDNTSEELSMLKDMMSQSSQQNLDCSQLSQKQPQSIYKPSPFKIHNQSNMHDKSTDCLNSAVCPDSLQPPLQQQQLKLKLAQGGGSSNRFGNGNGDESSIDLTVFDEKIKTDEKQPYNKGCNKQQERTKKLFQSHLQRLKGFEFSEEEIEDIMDFDDNEILGRSSDQLINQIIESRRK